MEAYLPSPHSLLVTDALRGWCIGGSWCPGLGAQVCTSSLPVATWRGPMPVARSGLFRGKGGPRASGLGACNSVHSGTAGCRQSRRARRCSPLWLLLRGYWVTPRLGISSALPRKVARMPLRWCSLGSRTLGPLDVWSLDLLHACFMPWGTGLWASTPSSRPLHGETFCIQAR